jgi:hypothetical protein
MPLINPSPPPPPCYEPSYVCAQEKLLLKIISESTQDVAGPGKRPDSGRFLGGFDTPEFYERVKTRVL